MSIAQSVQNKIKTIPPGRVFDYRDIPAYHQSAGAVVKAVNRMVADKRLARLSRGKFYIPKDGIFGPLPLTDGELIRSFLYKNGHLCGYVTGHALYNGLGLTTQVPKTITIACKGGRQELCFRTINIKKIPTRIPIKEKDVRLLQYLDALKNIGKIFDSEINSSLAVMGDHIAELSIKKQKRLIKLAQEYYGPQVRALVGLIYESLGLDVPKSLKRSLNPRKTFNLRVDPRKWPLAENWRIHNESSPRR